MTTPLIIVDGKNAFGKRLSVSIDEALWTLYIASRGFCTSQARKDLKMQMLAGAVNNTYDAKKWIYTEIANPALLPLCESLAGVVAQSEYVEPV